MEKMKAILVGISKYVENSGLHDLPGALLNVTQLKKVLKDNYEVDSKHFVDYSGKTKFLKELKNLTLGEDGVTIFYYSGHGVLNDSGDLYLTLSSSTDEDISIDGISLLELNSCINGDNIIFILDCCFSEKAFEGLKKRNYTIIASSSKNQTSKYPLEGEGSVFTEELIDILSYGIENQNSDLSIYDIYREVSKRLQAKEINMVPKIVGSDLMQKCFLGKNPYGLVNRKEIFHPSFIDRRTLIGELNQSLLNSTIEDSSSPKSIGEIFVPPPIYDKPEKISISPNKSVTKSNSESISIEQILEDSSNYILFGAKESGRTTILYYLAYEILNWREKYQHNIPCYIDFKNLNFKNKNCFHKSIRSFLSLSHSNVETILAEGNCFILIDNIDNKNILGIKKVKDFITQYSKNKFVFASIENLDDTIGVTDYDFGESEFKKAFVHAFSRKELGVIIEKWFINSIKTKQELKALKDKVYSTLVFTGIPAYPLNICFLLWIFESIGSNRKKIIHKSNLIEEFVEIVLEKFDHIGPQLNYDSVDYPTKRHFLAFLAGEMVLKNKNKLSFEQLVKETSTFFSNFGKNRVDVRSFINYLVQKGILTTDGHNYAFKYRLFSLMQNQPYVFCEAKVCPHFRSFRVQPKKHINVGTTQSYDKTFKVSSKRADHRAPSPERPNQRPGCKNSPSGR